MINYKALYLFYDIETTGTDPNTDRIVSIAWKLLDSNFDLMSRYHSMCDPGIPISPQASKVHGITDSMVSSMQVSPYELTDYMLSFVRAKMNTTDGTDLIVCGYNHTGFDNHFLCAEFGRGESSYNLWRYPQLDVYTLIKAAAPTLPSHKLSEVYRLVTGEELTDAHDAMVDVDATITVFRALLKAPLPFQTSPVNFPERIDELYTWKFSNEMPVDSEGKFVFDHTGKAYITFGKHKGMHLDKMARQEPGFLQWMLRGDFADDTKQIARDALSGMFPNRAEG